MRKGWAILLAIVLLLGGCCATAQEAQKAPDFILEGFDGDGSNRVWDTNLFFSRMEEKTGISFQFREYTNNMKWQERKEELCAGRDLPDVLFKAELSVGDTRTMYEAGYLIDLRPYLEEYAPDLWKLLQEKPEVLAAITLPDGAIPALPEINELQNIDAIWINSSWLRKVKKDMPTTAEELTEVLRAFRKGDANSNGKEDEVLSFIGMWELRFLGHAFGILDNDYYIRAQDGKVTSSLTTEENRAFLTWLNELWKENLLDHNGFTMADSLRQITDDKTTNPYGVFLSYTPLTVVPSSKESEYDVLEPLVYNGKAEYRELSGEVIRGTFAITSRCAEPEKLVSWVNYLYTKEGSRMALFGLEGQEYVMTEDGRWNWNEDQTTVANYLLDANTIGTGTAVPTIAEAEFQLLYADNAVNRSVEQLYRLKQKTVQPYPYVFLSKEDSAEIAGIQADLSPYVETTMACFVTGDLEMNDENWATFCATVQEKGLDRMIAIWQKYVEPTGGEK